MFDARSQAVLDRTTALLARHSVEAEAELAARNRFAALLAAVNGDDPPDPLTPEAERLEALDARRRRDAALAVGDVEAARAATWGFALDARSLSNAQAFAWRLLSDAERRALVADRAQRGQLNRAAWARLNDDQRVSLDALVRKRRESALLAGGGDESV